MRFRLFAFSEFERRFIYVFKYCKRIEAQLPRMRLRRARRARHFVFRRFSMAERLYVIYDRVAEECGPVFQAHNDGVALREFRKLLQQVTRQEEYKLYLVGNIDQAKMLIEPVVPPVEVFIADPGIDLFPAGKMTREDMEGPLQQQDIGSVR